MLTVSFWGTRFATAPVSQLRSKTSLILRTPTHPMFWKIYSSNTTKNMFVGCQKKHLCCTISRRSRTALGKQFSVYSCKSQLGFFSQRHRKLLSGGEGGWGEGVNNSFQTAHCLGLIKCFENFHFNGIFWKFNYYLAY